MQDGADLIYQAPLFDGQWRGIVDFLRRIPGESAFGDYAYEVLDTKLARQVKPHFVHQLCLYSELLAAVQGTTPRCAHIIRGDGTSVPVDLRRHAALHRHVVTQLGKVIGWPPRETYPEPVAHCDICDLSAECRKRLVDDDHLSLVATARRENREDLVDDGISTVVALSEAMPAKAPAQLGLERFEYLRRQAGLQVESRTTGKPTHLNLKPMAGSGYALLPEPSVGDLYFDLEGDPYVGDEGIEYLWGWWTDDKYEHRWAHDPATEKLALEEFVDRVVGLRATYPEMRVFHYAPHERAKLRSLAMSYATREVEVDGLLRGEVLVDLFAVVRQGIQIGEEAYSLKALERQHDFVRLEKGVREGGGSIVVYEQWLQTDEAELLESIRAYNEEDCRSTESLRKWLEGSMRPEAEAEFGVKFLELAPEEEEERGPPDWMDDVLRLIGRLAEPRAGDSADPQASVERELLGNLLLYHYRESKPGWWHYFDLRGKSPTDLVEDRDAVGELELCHDIVPTEWKRSLDYTFTFPAQETRLKPGDAEDPITGESCTVVSVTTDRIVLRRGKAKPPPAPVALISGSPINIGVLREALVDLAERVLDDDRATSPPPSNCCAGAILVRRRHSPRTPRSSSRRCSVSTDRSCPSRVRPGPARPFARPGWS